ncbi:MAG TPA: hypothetical protein VF173_03480 [Thermoanaerobaculia bacterium]|nr:hypothetical protein [Thermoanaerobaculia bacterium]
MLRMDVNRRLAALAVAVSLFWSGPLAAAGWNWEMAGKRVDSADFLKGGFFVRVLVWLGVAPAQDGTPTCDRGSSIDPNGCPAVASGQGGSSSDPNGDHLQTATTGATTGRGASIDPNGQPRTAASTTTTDRGSSIDPNGHH